VNYTPFSERPSTPARLQASPEPPRTPLDVLSVDRLEEDPLTGDFVIVGTGAAASVLAHELVSRGKDVLMLERGPYVDRSQFTENEVDMLSHLYADGALQLTRDFRFQVLQGSCVGGTTVVNNAVCFDLPGRVLDQWNDITGIDAQLSSPEIEESTRAVHALIGIQTQSGDFLNPSGDPILNAIRSLPVGKAPNRAATVDANIAGCLGCGYCNIGCAYGKKLSMLDRVLPGVQKDSRGRLRILAGCEVLRLRGRGRTITEIDCRGESGKPVRVRPGTVVLAAGAINSSLILLRSHAGGPNVGRRLSFNAGSPISGVFPDPIHAYAGLQISHYLEIEPSRGYVIETWYNPPVAQALTMPGWFDDHYENMRRYHRIASLGVLVGTAPNGRVQTGGLTGRIIDYSPTAEDLQKVLDGVTLGGEILFAAGAEEVMPHTFSYRTFRRTEQDAFREFPGTVKDASDITMGTGHPQGGNCLSGKDAIGVVTPEFKVRGYGNLFVCDASTFPTSVGVNPQVTVMTLAHYAARFVGARC
jgi:choline dehydrogenase-like flavoprotein